MATTVWTEEELGRYREMIQEVGEELNEQISKIPEKALPFTLGKILGYTTALSEIAQREGRSA